MQKDQCAINHNMCDYITIFVRFIVQKEQEMCTK